MGQHIGNLIEGLRDLTGDPGQGLPEELFEYVSQITPLMNIDLLIKEEDKGVLLTWRDDGHYEEGWHVPGGIIRYKETFSDRIHAVAKQELGTTVTFDAAPVTINQAIHPTNKTRGHFISLLFTCRLVSSPAPELATRGKPKNGHWLWHKQCPDNLISVHEIYRPYF